MTNQYLQKEEGDNESHLRLKAVVNGCRILSHMQFI